MSLHPFVVVFMVFWVGILSVFLFGSLTSDGQDALSLGAMLLFGLALTVVGFYPEAFKAERLIRAALEAAA